MTVINLRQTRKRKAKADAAKQAEANRVAHGISAKDRKRAETERKKQTNALDAHKREPKD